MVNTTTADLAGAANATAAAAGHIAPHLFGIPPVLLILLVAVILSFTSMLVTKYFTDQAMMRQIRDDVKKYQEQIKASKDNPQKAMELQNKIMALNSKLLPQSFRPMIITIIPFVLIFNLLYKVFNNAIIIPLSFWPGHLGFVGTYIIFSLIFTTIFKKLLKVV
ncbi:MAG: DUF106 domain-containing protein [DPANN group archaeon]|nr:DUF106 domain-containing protein [DPANN group archaeon]